jgi:hypothetical protein
MIGKLENMGLSYNLIEMVVNMKLHFYLKSLNNKNGIKRQH